MFYLLSTYLQESFGPIRVFQYPSFRIPLAVLTSLVVTLWLFPRFIELLRQRQHGVSNVREDTPEQHQQKSGTPTMGGLFIVLAVVATTMLWSDLSNTYIWAVVAVLIGFGAIGFVDDYRKIAKKNSKGIPGRYKLIWQTAILSGVTILMWAGSEGHIGVPIVLDTHLSVPFIPTRIFNPDITWLYLPFAFFVVVGTSNAVNLTDGLDGLAIGPTVVSAMTFLVLAYVAGLEIGFHVDGSLVSFNVAEYLNIPYVAGMSEIGIVCGSIAGAGVGFLWFNTFPATVFMGDVGSLALGGALGTVAVLTKNEFLSAIVHGVFLMEALSVITQVLSFKLTGKRIFRMAPIHHHFELKGWAEPKIIVRFWILSIILALFALVTLKLR